MEEISEKKKFRITVNSVDEADPEDVLKNLNGIRQNILSDKDTLNIKREQLEKNIQNNEVIEKEFAKAESMAKLWQSENQLMAKRTGKEVEEVQQHRADMAPEA